MQENKDPEAVRRRAMQDPEIQQIIADPAMQLILQQMQKDPQALREYVFSRCLGVCLSCSPPMSADLTVHLTQLSLCMALSNFVHLLIID